MIIKVTHGLTDVNKMSIQCSSIFLPNPKTLCQILNVINIPHRNWKQILNMVFSKFPVYKQSYIQIWLFALVSNYRTSNYRKCPIYESIEQVSFTII